MKFYLAPLRGITDTLFRTTFEKYFGKFDRLMAPFIPTYKGTAIKEHHLKDIIGPENDRSRVIPQIIGNDPEAFLILASAMADIGYHEINWNLGCPIPLIARKTRGSGLLGNKEKIRSFLDTIIDRMPCKLSVKVRLGYDNTTDLEKLIPIFNSYPLSEIIIHPRTGVQLYSGQADREAFCRLAPIFSQPTVYNGDIFTQEDFKQIAGDSNGTVNWMLGRGVLKNPFLLQTLRSDKSSQSTDTIFSFIQELEKRNSEFFPPLAILGKLKELWSYLADTIPLKGIFLIQILRSVSITEYNHILTTWKSSLK